MNQHVSECEFFHVIDLPDDDPTPGSWDFRRTEGEYHGGFSFKGKSILEIGTATGSHDFWMEKRGARVTPYDLAPNDSWGIMSAFDQDADEVERTMRSTIQRINNSWYYCRHRLNSKMELSFGSTYNIPNELGNFDVKTLGSVILHTRNPVGALQFACDRSKDAVIITDRLPTGFDIRRPLMEFMPKKELKKNFGGWP